MSAGLSTRQAWSFARRILAKIERELYAAGVPCGYRKQAVRYGVENPTPTVDVSRLPDRDFYVAYHHGHMSNGGSVLSGFISITRGTKSETFSSLDFERGLAKIRKEFGRR